MLAQDVELRRDVVEGLETGFKVPLAITPRKRRKSKAKADGQVLVSVEIRMVRPERFELPAFWFVARRSIQLSYGRNSFLTAFQQLTAGSAVSSTATFGVLGKRNRALLTFVPAGVH
jgi:hypothetical protein